MQIFTVNISDKLDALVDELKDSLGQTSRAEVFRLAIVLLKIAKEAKEQNKKLVIVDNNDKVEREILIPG